MLPTHPGSTRGFGAAGSSRRRREGGGTVPRSIRCDRHLRGALGAPRAGGEGRGGRTRRARRAARPRTAAWVGVLRGLPCAGLRGVPGAAGGSAGAGSARGGLWPRLRSKSETGSVGKGKRAAPPRRGGRGVPLRPGVPEPRAAGDTTERPRRSCGCRRAEVSGVGAAPRWSLVGGRKSAALRHGAAGSQERGSAAGLQPCEQSRAHAWAGGTPHRPRGADRALPRAPRFPPLLGLSGGRGHWVTRRDTHTVPAPGRCHELCRCRSPSRSAAGPHAPRVGFPGRSALSGDTERAAAGAATCPPPAPPAQVSSLGASSGFRGCSGGTTRHSLTGALLGAISSRHPGKSPSLPRPVGGQQRPLRPSLCSAGTGNGIPKAAVPAAPSCPGISLPAPPPQPPLPCTGTEPLRALRDGAQQAASWLSPTHHSRGFPMFSCS